MNHHSHLTIQGGGELVLAECADPACPMGLSCSHGPDRRCFDCATDEEAAAAIPDFPPIGGAA